MSSTTASRAGESPSMRSKRADGDQGKDMLLGFQSKISQIKRQIQAARFSSVTQKVEKNGLDLKLRTAELLEIATKRFSGPENVLAMRMASPLGKFGWSEYGEKDAMNFQEESSSSGALIFCCSGGKSAVCLTKLPLMEKIPPFTTWMFLDRNQQMTEDQSVVGRRQIYYDDRHGSEALICSDSEEENAEREEERHEFSKGEDEILWNIIGEYGPSQHVLNILCQSIEATSSEIEERYATLKEKIEEVHSNSSDNFEEAVTNGKRFLDKTLSAALDSLDNLFCRRCLIFDCRLHGCSQNLIIPKEKILSTIDMEEIRSPCGDQCYLRRNEDFEDKCHSNRSGTLHGMPIVAAKKQDITCDDSTLKEMMTEPDVCKSRKFSDKKQKVLSTKGSCLASIDIFDRLEISSSAESKNSESFGAGKLRSKSIIELAYPLRTDNCPGEGSKIIHCATDNVVEACMGKNFGKKEEIADSWSVIEKDLLLKGIEIFGKNSCLIARNMLSGLKTCMEVSSYMVDDKASLTRRTVLTSSCLGNYRKSDMENMEYEMPSRTRIWRRRGKAKKLKYTRKSAGHPSLKKRIADGKPQSCRQYTPCRCLQMCGKECPCIHNGTCCEKYCGCSKSCKNRFRGCHCAKSQCRSRQCPCFAAGRECDPDVCRNCWVSCGDDTLDEPPVPLARGDGYQCGNMKLLLKQRQRILLARSDVAGWGAFIKNPVNKNDYLGEYTGELVSHKEADKRGKIYDRTNSSFLFDLNDQYVLDAYRKGDKLKFANHSSNPNCYAKVMLVAGDHRVGIFAKERIEASEELFYDYRYGPDQAPAWARKPGGSKRDDSSFSHGRPQKVASRSCK